MADADNHRIVKLSAAGAPLAQWNTNVDNSNPNEQVTDAPQGIAVSVTGTVYAVISSSSYLLDRGTRVPGGVGLQQWSTGGRFLAERWQVGGEVAVDSHGDIYVGGSLSRGVAGQPVVPNALAVDARGNIYLTVGGGGVGFIQKLSPAGALLARFRLPGGGVGWVAVDRRGNIYVTNPAVPTPIQIFAATGKLLASWGTIGTKPDQFSCACSIAIDHNGNICVADAGHNRIHKLSPQGKQLAVWGTAGSDPGQFRQPVGVALDAQGNLYVLDEGNNRIQELPAGH